MAQQRLTEEEWDILTRAALAALQGFIASYADQPSPDCDAAAQAAFQYADAFLEEWKKRNYIGYRPASPEMTDEEKSDQYWSSNTGEIDRE